jgi:LPPG:FO 2-phospho-L-lactate transferase
MLGGGIGCSRLAVPLAEALPPWSLTLIVNTADDLWRYGLRICPDLDTNLYALAGLQDTARGWGVADETFVAMEQLRRLGDDPWFGLGDRDLALHLRRTALLREGRSLSGVTAMLADALDVTVHLLPMCEEPVATKVTTPQGELGFQEYLVQRRAGDPVHSVRYAGIEQARPGPGVLDAIRGADLLVVGPSNPVASIGPILGVAGIRGEVADRCRSGRPTVAVTPVVSGRSISDEGEAQRARCRAALLGARGHPHRATSVGVELQGLAHGFVLDDADADEEPALRQLGFEVRRTATVVSDPTVGRSLAAVVLGSGRS